jgi:hypothetical protein
MLPPEPPTRKPAAPTRTHERDEGAFARLESEVAAAATAGDALVVLIALRGPRGNVVVPDGCLVSGRNARERRRSREVTAKAASRPAFGGR